MIFKDGWLAVSISFKYMVDCLIRGGGFNSLKHRSAMANNFHVGSLQVKVKDGDTLWTLSQELGVPWQDIQSANGLQDHFIFPGDTLKIPLPKSSPRNTLRPLRTRPWIVQPGDTAWDISEKLGISLEELLSVNSSLPEVLFPGDVLQVPSEPGKIWKFKEVKARIKAKAVFGNANFFDVFPPPRDIDEYRGKYRVLLNALRHVETSFIMPAPTGDGGLSIGPLQISLPYHTDAWWLANEGAKYEDCEDVDYAERTVVNYWLRYCPWALEFGDIETLARTHNGGPQFWHHLSTTRYWRRVRNALKKYGYPQGFPQFSNSASHMRVIPLFSSHIPFPIPLFETGIHSPATLAGSSALMSAAASTAIIGAAAGEAKVTL